MVSLREEVMPGVWLLRLHSPRIARAGLPGQFVHLQCADGSDPLLRRPFSFCDIDVAAGTYDILFNVVGRGTAILAAAEAGQLFEALGPLGHPFSFPDSGTVMSVAGGLGVAPFPLVARAAQQRGLKLIWVNGAYTAHQLLPMSMLPGAAAGWLATDDGTAGHAGFVTDLLKRDVRAWIDAVSVIHACGPTPMLTALARLLRELSERSSDIPRCEVSLEAPMGCALGTCLGCVVPSADGSDPLLRRPFSFCDIDVAAGTYDILFNVVGRPLRLRRHHQQGHVAGATGRQRPSPDRRGAFGDA